MSFSLDAIYHSASYAIYSHSSALMDLQEKAATGQDVNRVSDDPINANHILNLRSEARTLEVHANALEEALSVLEFSDQVVISMSEELAESMHELTSALSGIMNAENDYTLRRRLAESLDSRLEQLVALANTQRLGRYLFAGADTDTAPYVLERDSEGQITRVTYQGSQEERNIEVAEGIEMSSSLVGDDLFRFDSREDPIFQGATGVAAGTGTSSVRGDIWMKVRPAGGTNYEISIDGGTTWTTVDSATDTNAAIVHPDTGEVMFIDATGITVTSETEERVRFPGTYDVFNVMIAARDMLQSQDRMSVEDWHTIMEDMVPAIRTVEQNLTRAFPVIGGRVDTLQTFKNSVEDIQYNTETDISRLQDADIAQVATDLARHEVLYQMSLNVAGKMFSLSLLDYL